MKRLGDFYRHPTCASGHMKTCKVCKRRQVRENRALKAEHYRAYNRARSMLPHHVARRQAYLQTARGRAVKRQSNLIYMRFRRMMERQAQHG